MQLLHSFISSEKKNYLKNLEKRKFFDSLYVWKDIAAPHSFTSNLAS